MKCTYCGKDVPEGAKFCDGCGAKMEEAATPVAETPVEQPNYGYQPYQKQGGGGKVVAIILAILVLLVGIGIAVYFIFFNGKKEEKENTNTANVENVEPTKTTEPTPTSTPKPTSNPTGDEEINCTANMKTDEFEMTMNTDAYLTDSNRKLKKIVFTYIYDIKIPLIAEEFEKQKDVQCNTFKTSLNRGAKQDCKFERDGNIVKFVISFEELYSTYESTGTTSKSEIIKAFEDQMKLEVKEYNGTASCK